MVHLILSFIKTENSTLKKEIPPTFGNTYIKDDIFVIIKCEFKNNLTLKLIITIDSVER